MKYNKMHNAFKANNYYKNKNNNYNLKKQTPFRMFPILLKWLANTLTKSTNKETTLAMKVTDKILTTLKTRGKPEAIKYCKDLRAKFQKIILSMSEEFDPGELSRLPKVLRPVVSHMLKAKSYPFIRLILSALYITRFLRLPPEPDFETVERPSFLNGKLPKTFSKTKVKGFLKAMGVNPKSLGKVPKSLRFEDFHMTSKSGPNGHALWTSYIDAFQLSEETKDCILTIGGERLYKKLLDMLELYPRIPDFFGPLGGKPEVARRLSAIQDKEGKTRLIAIGDYYSQAALLPLHNYLHKLLDRISQDCTSDQTKLFDKLQPTKGHKFHSVDLTAFTDLFPIEVNSLIIETLFGKAFAKAWKHLMVGLPFNYQHKVVYYRTGNPMGLYSSWASTSLAHHYVVYLACQRAKRNWKKCPYMLLGDDIVIADDNVYEHYLCLLSELGCEVNMSKTHNSYHGFEFAKQIRLHGRNISPFPLSALFERRTEVFTTLGIIFSEIRCKSWDVVVLSTLEEYYLQVFGWPRPRVRAVRPTFRLVMNLILYLQGQEVLGKAIRRYVASFTQDKSLYKKLPKHHKRLLTHWYAVKTVQELFMQSKDQVIDNKKHGKLGKLVGELHVATLLAEVGAKLSLKIPSVPFFNVYTRSQLRYNELFDELYDLGLGVPGEQLRTYIGKVDIPLHDHGFYTRNRDIIVVKAMKSAKILTALIKSTTEVVASNGQLRIPIPWAAYCRPEYGSVLKNSPGT